jgi:hypothetical protein
MAEVTITEPIHGDTFTVGTSVLPAYTASNRASHSSPEVMRFQNTHASQIVTVGGSDVASLTNGVVLSAQYGSVDVQLTDPGAKVYLIANGASTTVNITRIG